MSSAISKLPRRGHDFGANPGLTFTTVFTEGQHSMTPLNLGSTAHVMCDSGKCCFRATATGSVHTQSPSADKREIRILINSLPTFPGQQKLVFH
jgi:hypothetical protein